MEKLLEVEVDAKVLEPTPQELEAYYQDQMERGSKPGDKAKRKLESELKQLRVSSAREAHLKLLQQQADVVILVDPPRAKVSVDPMRLAGEADAPIDSTLKKIIAKYEGKVSLAYRDFPMSELHPQAELAAEASRCALEQGKFWQYHDSLFHNPGNISREDLLKFAEDLHLSARLFDSCLSSGKYKPQVGQDLQDGLRAGVFGTPGFFINGIFLAGSQPASAFEKIIDEELAGMNQSRARTHSRAGLALAQ